MDIEEKMENASSIKKVFIVLFFAVLMAGLVAVVMMIWNAILPDVIGVSEVNYWQMLGIIFLSKLLFGGNKFGSNKHKKRRQWREKFQNMTTEEKEAFKSEWRSRRDNC